MRTTTYDPLKNLLSFAGVLATGFAPDTFIKVERNEDAFSLVVGASGEAVRTQNRNRSGKVTVTLLAKSQTNDLWSAIAAGDELAGTGVAPFFLKELNGTTRVSAENAWLTRPAAIERAKEAGNVEWIIECENLDMFAGGLTA